MSYILEALKKLEEKRRQDTMPNSLTAHISASVPQKKRTLWPYFIVLALLLNAGLLLWWLQPWRSGKPNFSVQTIDRQSLTKSTSMPHKDKGIQHRLPPATSSADNSEISVAPPDVSVQTRESGHLYKNIQTQSDVPLVNSEQKKGEKYELPPSLRHELPVLTIAGHYYDGNPASRIVIINGKTLREGQIVTPGLKLDQITESGVLFSYQGYRFHKGVF